MKSPSLHSPWPGRGMFKEILLLSPTAGSHIVFWPLFLSYYKDYIYTIIILYVCVYIYYIYICQSPWRNSVAIQVESSPVFFLFVCFLAQIAACPWSRGEWQPRCPNFLGRICCVSEPSEPTWLLELEGGLAQWSQRCPPHTGILRLRCTTAWPRDPRNTT